MKIEKSPVIDAPCGPVQGRLFDFEDGNRALAFQGIPFGKAPIGDLRFKVSLVVFEILWLENFEMHF
jgi:carboxylesterase type B